jgi:hypothetical protein
MVIHAAFVFTMSGPGLEIGVGGQIRLRGAFDSANSSATVGRQVAERQLCTAKSAATGAVLQLAFSELEGI